jgi:hypothetical protein
MARKAALLGFLAVQAIAIALWVSAAWPFLTSGKPLVETAQQIWSGGGFSQLDSSFRMGRNVVLAPQFDPFGVMLTGTILMGLAGVAAVASIFLWRRSKVWLAVTASVAALLLGAGGNWYIATQWQGDTAFKPGHYDTGFLYALSKAFNTQFYLGFVLFALTSVAVIAGFASRERPLGFQLAAVNWIIVAGVWLLSWVFLYVMPHAAAAG